jgi:drug/metabolite transporter (DMT)-like permease
MSSAPTSSTRGAAIAATVACICFGASVVVTRYVVPQTTPVVLAFLRYVIASVCVLVFAGRRAFPRMPAGDRWQVALLGVLFFGIFPWSFSASLTHLPSTHVALIVATNPLVTLALSVLRGLERPTPRSLAGQLLAFAGLAIALPKLAGPAATAAATATGTAWIGYLEVSLTVLSGSVYNVYSRPLLMRYPSLAVTGQAMAIGALSLAPLALLQGLGTHTASITPGGWLAVLFLGSLGGAVGFGLWSFALRRSTPSKVAVFLALNPITAITLGVLLLHEPVTVRLLIGLVAVIAGIQLATRAPRVPVVRVAASTSA